MSDDHVPVRLGEIPPELMDQPGVYSTTIVGVNGENQVGHYGTGTFVKSGDRLFILTAAHCVERLFKCERIGLPIRLGGSPLYIQKLDPIFVAKRLSDEWGPDLAFVPIDPVDGKMIHACSNRTFYNLDKRETETVVGDSRFETHLWALVGSPISESNIEGPDRYEFTRNTYTGVVEYTTTKDLFDYFEIRVSVAGKKVDDTFMKGASGGGVWYANLGRNEDGSFVLTENARLEGVAFYRTPQEGEFLHIRCHGRRSLYAVALPELRVELTRRSGHGE